ncbi:MAG: 50S ribosomal protein L13 [Planctomycetaceae bacterium]|nr:50S ribosomal protein L13 [Planctomycetaceae bacterium]
MSADHSQKTFNAKPGQVARDWHVIDAKGRVLGRLAQEIAMLLMGKHKAEFTPNSDTGDFVIVLNVGEIDVTGSKRENKMYQRYSGYPSGLREESFASLNKRKPGEPLRLAVRRMLPRNNLGRKMLTKLKLFAGAEHPHGAQSPKPYELKGRAVRVR